MPFRDDFSIDERALRSHLDDLASTDGVTAVVVNGHASEAACCSPEEQRRIVDIAVEQIGGQVAVIAGIYADGSLPAAELARSAEAAGAHGVLVFPTSGYISAHPLSMVVRHYGHIADACSLPITVFQYPEASGHCYPVSTLVGLAEAVPSIVAVKDNARDIQAHDRHIRALSALSRPVNVLTTHANWLLSTLALGSHGIISGSGSILAPLHVELWRAVQSGDLHRAREVSERIHRAASVLYAEPRVDQHNRMKEGLVLLGRLPRAVVRPPLGKLGDDEIERIRAGLVGAGLLNASDQAGPRLAEYA